MELFVTLSVFKHYCHYQHVRIDFLTNFDPDPLYTVYFSCTNIFSQQNFLFKLFQLKLHSDRGDSSPHSAVDPLLANVLDGYTEEELAEYRQVFNMFDSGEEILNLQNFLVQNNISIRNTSHP